MIDFLIIHARVSLALIFLILGVGASMVAGEDAPPAAGGPIEIAVVDRADPVNFERDLLPVLRNNCLACHGAQKPKGGLVLETPQTIAEGGDSGPVVVPGNGAESFLLKVAAHQIEDTVMPPKNNKSNAQNLTPRELGLLKLWIDQGAKGEVRAARPLEWRPLPPNLNAIHAVSVSADGQFAACGRGNRIDLYHLPTHRKTASLHDTDLVRSGLYAEPGPAHRDFVQALAFHPSGDLLASGGYREVKLWRRIREFAPVPPRIDSNLTVRLAAASGDGRWLATFGSDQILSIWSSADGGLTRRISNAAPDMTAVALTADGSKVAAGSSSGRVQVWSVESGDIVAAFDAPSAVRALAWIGSNARLAIGQADHSIRVWRLDADREAGAEMIQELKGHEGPVTALAAVDADGNQVMSGSQDGSVRLWRVEDGKAIHTMDQGGPVTGVAVRPDGKLAASAGENGSAKIWKVEDGKLSAGLKGDRYALETVAAMERGKTLAAAEVAYRKGDLESAEKEHKEQGERVKKALEAFEPAEKAYAETKKALDEAVQTKESEEKSLADLHRDIERVTASFQSADTAAKQAEAAAKEAVLTAAQARSDEARSLQQKLEAEAFLADAQKIAERARTAASMSSLEGEAKQAAELRAADAETVVSKAKTLAAGAQSEAEALGKASAEARAKADAGIDQVAAKAFAAGLAKVEFDRITLNIDERLKKSTNAISEAAKKVASSEKEFHKAEFEKSKTQTELELARGAEQSGASRVEEARSQLARAEKDDELSASELEVAKKSALDRERPMTAVTFFEEGLEVATATQDGRILTWSAENGRAIEVFEAGDRPLTSLAAFGPRKFVAGAEGGTPRPAREIRETWVLERVIGTGGADSPLADRVNALAFSPDGALLASGGGEPSRSGEIKVWRIADGTLAADLPKVHSDSVLSLEFSPDGTRLASGAADKFARITRWETGEVERALEGHTHHVMGVAWKADGRTLATSGADQAIKVWDVPKGERKKNIQGFDKEITSIQFVGVTDQAVVCSGDHRVRLIKEDGKTVRDFGGVEDFQHAVAVTPDGRTVVAGGEASVLRVWNGEDGKILAKFD